MIGVKYPDLPFLGVLTFLVFSNQGNSLVFRVFSAAFFFSLTVVERGLKILGVLDGFAWCFPLHQGMEDHGNGTLFDPKQT